MKRLMKFTGVALSTLLLSGIAMAQEKSEVFVSKDDSLKLATVTIGPKTLDLTIGVGSSLFHAPGDPENVFYSLTDRGPNIDCSEAKDVVGADATAMCAGDEKGKIFPTPDFVPSIFKLELSADGALKVLEQIKLADSSGKTITGLPNPLKAAKTEKGYDKDGKLLPFDPNGLDTEGLVRLDDGTFWLADEYAPSLVHVAADGKIIERLVPAGVDADLAGAGYKVTGSLPAILAKRQLNRGIEGVAVSPDNKFIYALVQNPLANPDADTYKKASASRILKVDAATGKPVGEYIYQLDAFNSFANDPKAKQQSDVRLSEISAIGPDKLIVLERIAKTSKLYLVDLVSGSNILGSAWDDVATSPSLEQIAQTDLAGKGVQPVAKTLWLDSKDWADLPEKVEGVSIPVAGTLVVINDDDFGITGEKTKAVRLKLILPGM